jgi:hypothetical protein
LRKLAATSSWSFPTIFFKSGPFWQFAGTGGLMCQKFCFEMVKLQIEIPKDYPASKDDKVLLMSSNSE